MRTPHYWVGIDEAGYGPNLGPLVVAAVVAKGSSRPPDVWADLPFVGRADAIRPDTLCVDDSKKVLSRRDGRIKLEHAIAALAGSLSPAPGPERAPGPGVRRKSIDWSALGPDVFGGPELARWSAPAEGPIDWHDSRPKSTIRKRFVCRRWRMAACRIELIGPERFNRLLEETGNKSEVNGQAFLELIQWLREIVPAGATVHVTTDRHGGRHYYGALLARAFPGLWIDKRDETPRTSRYRVNDGRNEFELTFVVSADASDGFVALASMVAKLVRERWMDRFNAWFARRIPDLRPTAGYPADAKRFLEDVRHVLVSEGIDMDSIWRRK